jgi:hypothetical protein
MLGEAISPGERPSGSSNADTQFGVYETSGREHNLTALAIGQTTIFSAFFLNFVLAMGKVMAECGSVPSTRRALVGAT